MLGLRKARVEVPSQLASKFGFPRKFAACLAFLNGLVLSGNEPSYDSISGTEISRSHTPLAISPDATNNFLSSILLFCLKLLSLTQKVLLEGQKSAQLWPTRWSALQSTEHNKNKINHQHKNCIGRMDLHGGKREEIKAEHQPKDKQRSHIPFNSTCWKIASRPDSIFAEMILSMTVSLVATNSRTEATFLCISRDGCFSISTRRATTSKANTSCLPDVKLATCLDIISKADLSYLSIAVIFPGTNKVAQKLHLSIALIESYAIKQQCTTSSISEDWN
ncbi:hypothetical protein SADUNF_Sadunf10G0083100 [Salix dunnii]|uniref:Uncharacterized protein n=1 Tax=Salix dunnii TaxID=1413687 RepID=A0A835JPE9_9ROSI|nr:hypothetical protein SADUNF_Sadunf10G0083100 [Salix dunnii]